MKQYLKLSNPTDWGDTIGLLRVVRDIDYQQFVLMYGDDRINKAWINYFNLLSKVNSCIEEPYQSVIELKSNYEDNNKLHSSLEYIIAELYFIKSVKEMYYATTFDIRELLKIYMPETTYNQNSELIEKIIKEYNYDEIR